MNKSSKIYIAGHKGLVGSAIVKNLESKGYTNLIYKTHAQLDLTNQQAVVNFFENEKPEYVVLAAAKVGGIVANDTYRADFIYENLAIQNNVIHQSYLRGVKKLLFLGSTCIYPKNAPQPMNEDALLTSPLEYTNEPYAIAKIAGVKMCESYNIQYGTNFISVMPTNLYGVNDNFDLETSHVLPALIRKIHLAKLLNEKKYDEVVNDIFGSDALASQDKIQEAKTYLARFGVDENQVEIWGTGLPRREFLYSDDMADACVYLMENIDFKDIIGIDDLASTKGKTLVASDTLYEKVSLPKEIRNTHLNIGTGKDISIKELAELIKKIVGFKGELTFNTQKPDGTMLKRTDPSKLNNLGWRYKVELEDGIKSVYEWYLNK